mmetsp:Transcript_3168/g.2640  ORF Transcript_3168/g.2640 Transcript_3168/m.2640 type:complete len:98 (-) Transcript_3168:308-601(-)
MRKRIKIKHIQLRNIDKENNTTNQILNLTKSSKLPDIEMDSTMIKSMLINKSRNNFYKGICEMEPEILEFYKCKISKATFENIIYSFSKISRIVFNS